MRVRILVADQSEARGSHQELHLVREMLGPLGSKGAMLDGMPVARGERVQATALEFSHAAIEWGDDLVASQNSQGSARQKIVLDVNQNEGITPPRACTNGGRARRHG